MTIRKYLFIAILGFTVSHKSLFAQTKRIVTYIEDVQEERKSTRWTLTEWLRIKERMKLMDVWLAMFSKPEQKFAPELTLGYAKGVGESEFRLGSIDGLTSNTIRGTNAAEEISAKFWFTNLVSGTTGLRTLNIDLGLEGLVRNRFMKDDEALLDSSGESWLSETDKLQTAGVNLRLFGASSQDSSLVIKGGKFEKVSGFDQLDKISGTYFGAEMSLYLLSFLGAEGQYYQYLDGKDKKGSRVQAMGFLEIYNIRLSYGQERDEWDYKTPLQKLKTKDFERYLSLRVYF